MFPYMCSVSMYTYVYYFINIVECCKRTEVCRKHRRSIGERLILGADGGGDSVKRDSKGRNYQQRKLHMGRRI